MPDHDRARYASVTSRLTRDRNFLAARSARPALTDVLVIDECIESTMRASEGEGHEK